MHPSSNASKNNKMNGFVLCQQPALLHPKKEALRKSLVSPTNSHQNSPSPSGVSQGGVTSGRSCRCPGRSRSAVARALFGIDSDRESRILQPATLTDPTNCESTTPARNNEAHGHGTHVIRSNKDDILLLGLWLQL